MKKKTSEEKMRQHSTEQAEFEKQIHVAIRRGVTVREVARQMKCSMTKVYIVARKDIAPLREKREKMIIDRLQKGISPKTVAVQMKCSITKVYSIAKVNNLARGKIIPRWVTLEKQIMSRLRKGVVAKEVVAQVGCSVSDVYLCAKRHDLSLPKRPLELRVFHGTPIATIISWRTKDELTLEEIGQRLNYTRERIRQILAMYGVEFRRGEAEAKLLADKVRKLAAKGLQPFEIARESGISVGKIANIRKTYDIPIIPRLACLRDRRWLYDQYMTRNKCGESIAVEAGCTQATVIKALHRLNIPIKPMKLYKNLGRLTTKTRRLENASWLKAQVDKGKTKLEVARELGCSVSSVHNAMRRHGIKPLPTASVGRGVLFPQLENKQWLQECYTRGMSRKQIADTLSCSINSVSVALRIHGIKFRRPERV